MTDKRDIAIKHVRLSQLSPLGKDVGVLVKPSKTTDNKKWDLATETPFVEEDGY